MSDRSNENSNNAEQAEPRSVRMDFDVRVRGFPDIISHGTAPTPFPSSRKLKIIQDHDVNATISGTVSNRRRTTESPSISRNQRALDEKDPEKRGLKKFFEILKHLCIRS